LQSPGPVGGVDSHPNTGGGIKVVLIRIGMGNNHWSTVLNLQIQGEAK